MLLIMQHFTFVIKAKLFWIYKINVFPHQSWVEGVEQ